MNLLMMRRARASLARLYGSFRRSQYDRDILEEFGAHIQMQIDANLRDGMTVDAARRAALVASGGITQTLERCRDNYSNRWLNRLLDWWDVLIWRYRCWQGSAEQLAARSNQAHATSTSTRRE